MKNVKYKHWFKIDKKLKLTLDDKDAYTANKIMFREKRGYLVFYEDDSDMATENQLGFLFGGIIRGSCMQSNEFIHFNNEEEILDYFIWKLRSYMKAYKTGKESIVVRTTENWRTYGKLELSRLISDIIIFLEQEHGIFVKDSKLYKYE